MAISGISSTRLKFFKSLQDDEVFARPDWKGALLERDRYDAHRMPRVLWNALSRASGTSTWHVCSYGMMDAQKHDHEPPPVPVSGDWEEFASDKNPVRKELEWILFEDQERFAILVDPEITLIGCCPEFALAVDTILAEDGLSLRDLTEADFGVREEWGYLTSLIVAVLGDGLPRES